MKIVLAGNYRVGSKQRLTRKDQAQAFEAFRDGFFGSQFQVPARFASAFAVGQEFRADHPDWTLADTLDGVNATEWSKAQGRALQAVA